MQASPTNRRRALLILIAVGFGAVVLTFRPFAKALFGAAVLAVALAPLHRRTTALLRGRSRAAALGLIAAGCLAVVATVSLLSAVVVSETRQAVQLVRETIRTKGAGALVEKLPDPLATRARSVLERLQPQGEGGSPTSPGEAGGSAERAEQTRQKQGGEGREAPRHGNEEGERPPQTGRSPEQGSGAAKVAGAAKGALAATGSFAVQAAMMLIALFFFLTEKNAMVGWVAGASPLTARQTSEIIEESRRVSFAVVRSTVLTAAIQALAAMIGYLIARVPHVIFFTGLTFVLALVPVIGGAIACLGAALLMLLTGHTLAAAFLALWAVTAVGLSDNLAKPLLAKGDIGLHGGVVFFALVGGLAAFGTIGIVLGPVAVAFFVTVLKIYRRDFASEGGGEDSG